MRKLLLLLVVTICCSALGGCWFFDAEHNRQHWKNIKTDLRGIHQDLDFLLALDHEPSLVDDRYR